MAVQGYPLLLVLWGAWSGCLGLSRQTKPWQPDHIALEQSQGGGYHAKWGVLSTEDKHHEYRYVVWLLWQLWWHHQSETQTYVNAEQLLPEQEVQLRQAQEEWISCTPLHLEMSVSNHCTYTSTAGPEVLPWWGPILPLGHIIMQAAGPQRCRELERLY